MDKCQVLRTARQLITPEDKWTVGTRHTADGRMCALGAIESALVKLGAKTYYSNYSDMAQCTKLLALALPDKRTLEALPEESKESYERRNGPFFEYAVAHYNNHHTHAEVLTWFDRAVAICEEA